MIKDYKKEHDNYKSKMITGENYYNQENEVIMQRQKLMGIKRGESYHQVVDPYASNFQLPSGFLKQQVKQKVNYLIGESMTLTDQEDLIQEVFPAWKKEIKQLATKVSYQIYGAWQFYIKDGMIAKKFISGKQLYPVFREGENKPYKVIRFYSIDDKEYAIEYDNKVEKHFVKKGTKWEQFDEKPILKLNNKIANDIISEDIVELPGPPFAFLYNNDEMKSDLQPIKPHVDVFDIVDSDFANNIVDFQEIYHTLKNYQGQDLAEFNQQLKMLKTVPIAEDGEFKTHMAEVPVVAKQTYLDMKRKDIFEYGMAVDLKDIAAGNATVVAIKSMYENLNMKCNDFEQELQDFWANVLELTNFFATFTNQIPSVLDNRIIFDKAMLMNEKDLLEGKKIQVEMLQMLMGVLDKETLLELAASVDFVQDNIDVDAEELIKRFDQAMAGIVIEEGE